MRLVAEAALASAVTSVIMVVGNRAAEVADAVKGLGVVIVENSDYEAGLSSSLRVGIESLSDGSDTAMILLADMPNVGAETIDSLIDAFEPDLGRHIVVPTFEGKAGNPVLWSRRFYSDLTALHGDMGAREMIRANSDAVAWIKTGSAVTRDVDTPEALVVIGGSWT